MQLVDHNLVAMPAQADELPQIGAHGLGAVLSALMATHIPPDLLVQSQSFPLTKTQHRIVSENDSRSLWASYCFKLPNYMAFSLDRLRMTWQALAAHHAILRTTINVNKDSSIPPSQHVTSNILPLALGIPSPAPKTLPYLVYDEVDGAPTITIHFSRALLDSLSILLLWQDFWLFYHGYSFAPRTPFSIHARLLEKEAVNAFPVTDGESITSYTNFPPVSHNHQDILESSQQADLDSLLRLSNEHDVDVRILLRAAWALVLACHTGSDHVAFCTNLRPEAPQGEPDVLGPLTTLSPFGITVESQETTAMFLARLGSRLKQSSSAVFLSSYETQDMPQTAFFVSELDIPSCEHRIDDIPVQIYFCLATGMVKIRHHSEVPVPKARVILAQFAEVLPKLLPDSPFKDISLVSASERNRILSFGPKFRSMAPPTVHSMVEDQARRRESMIAVQTETESFTFQELNSAANKVAHQLIPLLGSVDIVPVHMDTSSHLIIALLAILKAGKGYVIVDPLAPPARKAYIMKDVEASVCLVDQVTADPEFESFMVLDINLMLNKVSDESNPSLDVSPESTAYIIYTSGSTGYPKGTVLSHRAVAAGIACASGSTDTRALLFYNPVFSAAQRTILSTLAHGGCLCIASRSSLHSSLARLINEMRVNTLGITASTINLLDPKDAPTLKRVTLTGERVTGSTVDTWADRVELRNSFGLSECTQLTFGRQLKVGDRSPNVVGQPADTTSAYVLVPGTSSLAPFYVAGELCLEGPQLASKYLNKPEVTAKSFFPSPFNQGEIMYRTGDMAIRHEDGSIEIVGRIDFQTKINGQRVEPGEISNFIRTQPGVVDAVVVAVTLDGENTLAACVVGNTEWPQLVVQLRDAALAHLPVYMVPRYFVSLDALPLNSNGKTDVLKLRSHLQALGRPALVHSSSRPADDRVALSPEAATMRSVWSQVLDIPTESISAHHTFLEVGGDSLKALKVISHLLELGWEISLGHLMRAESLSCAADEMVEHQAEGSLEPFSLLSDTQEIDKNIYEDAYPATELQMGIISAHSTVGGYVYHRTFDIDGLDLPRLQEAFQKIINRHPIFRTCFLSIGSGIVQAVRKSFELPWEFRESEAGAELHEVQKHEHLDISEPAIRATVVNDSLLVVSMHHALFDFWSSRFLFDDAEAIYQNLPAPERVPFNSFVKHIQQMDHGKMEGFWREHLEGAASTQIGAEVFEAHVLKRQLDCDIRTYSAKTGFSTGVLLYLAWAILLCKHTGSSDVVFGVTLSGRDVLVPGIQELNGPTLTTVPLRIILESTKTVSQCLQHMQKVLWEVAENSQYGLRKGLQAAGHTAGLFDTLVNILVDNTVPEETRVLRPHGDKPVWQTEYTTLEVRESVSGRFELGLSSTLDRIKAKFILDELAQVINAVTQVDTSQTSLREIDVITPAERLYLTSLCPEVQIQPDLLHSKFEKLAATNPDQIALEFEQSTCTYGELETRANQFAHFLVTNDVGSGDFVPICLSKSIEVIIVTIAVLKAGAAFVHLDPDNPPERNNFIVEDVSAKMIVTDENFRDIFDGATHAAEVVDFYSIDTSTLPGQAPEREIRPEDLAYCIYTSGSTGLPKGVLVTHRAISAGIDSIIEAESVEASWRLLQFSNFVFDVSVSDIFCMLSTGATLCLANPEAMLYDLAKVVNDNRITRLFLTPTVAKLLQPADVPGIEGIYLAGELVPQDVADTWMRHCTVMNCYGPTEASVLSVAGFLKPNQDARVIGKPLKNIRAMVLEPDNLDLVPYGAIGELCLAGPQLAEGYLNRPESTSKAFVERDGEKVYRTGDLVRWLGDGRIQCFGRIDSQVKIHGHRIELGEIESAIRSTGEVQSTAVVVQKVRGNPTLIAFCVTTPHADEGILPPEQYRQEHSAISVKLTGIPQYMVPGIWIPLGTLPLLPSGKTDRKKLTAWVQNMGEDQLQKYSSTDVAVDYVGPETPTEAVLQDLWAQLFGRPADEISVLSSFLSHGGDSIAAINLVGRCRSKGIGLAVGDVLAFPLLRDMAVKTKLLQNKKEAPLRIKQEASEDLEAILKDNGLHISEIEAVYPVVPGIEDFLTRANADEQFWNCQTVRPLPEALDFDVWTRVATQMTARNSILRSMWVQEGAIWRQVVLAKPVLDLKTVSCATEDERKQYIEESWRENFKVGKPFIKYRLIELPEGRRDLLIHIHHAMYDGTLLRIFDDEFKALYKGLSPPEAVPFEDFIGHMASSARPKALNFWKDMLHDAPAPFPAVEKPSTTGVLVGTAGRAVDAFASACGITVPIVFQTSFSLLLCHLSGQNDVVYDNLITGRNVDIENVQSIAGTCANFLPFRTSCAADTGIRDLLLSTQSLFWKTTEHGNVGLNDIYGHLDRPRSSAASRALFLFQPFEPVVPSSDPVEKHMRWMVMALSQVRMPIDYALHLEVSKTAAGYNVKFKYDATVYSEESMRQITDTFNGILDKIIANPGANVSAVI